MFRLRYCPKRAGGGWHVAGGRLLSPDGWIEPFDHPMIELQAVAEGERLIVAIVERPWPASGKQAPRLTLRTGDFAADERQLHTFLAEWPLHWFRLEFDGAGVTLESGPLPTAPVFTTDDRQAAVADWDPLALYGAVDPVLDDAAAHYLASFEQPYGTRTVIRQIRRLAVGYRAGWRHGQGWEFVRPAAAPRAFPRALQTHADPVASLDGLLNAALARLLPDAATPVAAALSGGLDSTAVCAVAARRGHPTATFGLLMPGAGAAAQQARRRAGIALFGLRDGVQACDGPAPGPGDYGRTGYGRMVPWEELHYDRFDRLYAAAAAAGHTVFLSGFGGDELMAPYWDELPDRDVQMAGASTARGVPGFLTKWVAQGRQQRLDELMSTPVAYVQRSVLEAIGGSASQAMRHGLWPIHLLATPGVVRYCHSLPQEWRTGRRLMRALLAWYGLPRSVTQPGATESFTPLSNAALAACATGGTLQAPQLADLGLVEPDALARAFARWRRNAAPPGWDLHLIAVAVLEAALDSIRRRRRAAPDGAGARPVH